MNDQVNPRSLAWVRQLLIAMWRWNDVAHDGMLNQGAVVRANSRARGVSRTTSSWAWLVSLTAIKGILTRVKSPSLSTDP